MSGEPLVWATVGPLASAVIVRQYGAELERTARRFEVVGTPLALAVARQLRRAVAEMEEMARLRNLFKAGIGSVDGTSEPRGAGDGARSGSPPWNRLTAGEVAERSGVSVEYVKRLCRTEGLLATKRGGQWLIDPVSAEEWMMTRST